MAEFDLSTLSGPELRGLLDSTRKRGQAAQAYRILQEMAARRAKDEGGDLAGRPRTVDVDLSDPLERHEDPLIEPPAEPAPEEALGADLAEAIRDRRPARHGPKGAKPKARRRSRAEPEPRWDRPAREAKRPRRWPGLVFAAGAALGVVVGVGIAAETFGAIETPVAAFLQAPAPTPEPQPLPPPAAPLAEPEVTGPPPVEAAASPQEVADNAAAAAVEAAAAAPEPAAEPEPEPAVVKAAAKPAPAADKPEKAAPAAKPCAGVPADCVIRQDPRLQRLQKELRAAYAAALEAHEDRDTLRERQLAWRDGRDEVDDPDRLASLYEARIRKLNAATAEARRARRG